MARPRGQILLFGRSRALSLALRHHLLGNSIEGIRRARGELIDSRGGLREGGQGAGFNLGGSGCTQGRVPSSRRAVRVGAGGDHTHPGARQAPARSSRGGTAPPARAAPAVPCERRGGIRPGQLLLACVAGPAPQAGRAAGAMLRGSILITAAIHRLGLRGRVARAQSVIAGAAGAQQGSMPHLGGH